MPACCRSFPNSPMRDSRDCMCECAPNRYTAWQAGRLCRAKNRSTVLLLTMYRERPVTTQIYGAPRKFTDSSPKWREPSMLASPITHTYYPDHYVQSLRRTGVSLQANGGLNRNQMVPEQLHRSGRRIAVVWECELHRGPVSAVADLVAAWLRDSPPFLEPPAAGTVVQFEQPDTTLRKVADDQSKPW